MTNSTSTTTQQTYPSAAEQYLASPEFTHFPVGAGQEIVFCPATRMKQIISKEAVVILNECRSPASLEQHAAVIGTNLNIPQEAVRDLLAMFSDVGLLVSNSALLKSLSNSSLTNPETKHTVPPSIQSIGTPTRNRPDQLRLGLTSFMQTARHFERSPRVVIADSSNTIESQEANQALLRDLSKEFSAEVSYFGTEQRHEFADALVKKGLPSRAVDFALFNETGCPVDIGTNRNMLLLHTFGEITIQFDDDHICRVAANPELEEKLTLTSSNNPTEFWFEPVSGNLETVSPLLQKDFFALHETLLGKSIAQCIEHFTETEKAPLNERVSINEAEARFFRRAANGASKVRITALGMFGDSGMTSSSAFLTIGEKSRNRLLRSEDDYRNSMLRHQVLRSTKNYIISDDPFCMAGNLGLDNRELLPPFMPVQRNEDGAFAALMKSCAFDGYFGFAPFALEHRRERPRDLIGLTQPPNMMTGDFMQPLIRSFSPIETVSPEQNLRSLGRLFCDWGDSSISEFKELLRFTIWRQASNRITMLERHLETTERQPEYWAHDVETYIEAYRNKIAADDYATPADLVTVFGADKALYVAQNLVYRFGELLSVWGEMCVAARELRENSGIGRLGGLGKSS